jgi:type IV secretion system protein VirB8
MKNIITNLKTKLTRPTGQTKDAITTARNWYSDRFQNLEIQRSFLIVLLILSCAAIALLSFELTYVKGTRSIEPFVIEIEPKTGVATVVTPLDSKIYSEDEIVKKYFVWHYVKLREEYNHAIFDQNFAQVELFSSPQVFSVYARTYRRGNKNSPIEQYGSSAIVTADFKSITTLSVNPQTGTTVQVRFRTSINGTGGGATDYIATLSFMFDNSKLNEKQRVDNPLGFTVTDYRLEREYVG